MSETFDFIVVGGGSAGCIVAAELAASGRSVLLLEAGQRAEENPESLTADTYKDAFVNDRLMHERFTVAQEHCGGRSIFAGTGRGMGGSGGINAMVYTRGAREDFEAWGDGWRWDDVVPHFAELEARLDVRRRPPTEFTEACIGAAASTGFRRKEDLNDGDLSGVLGYEWMNYRGEERRSAYASFIRGRSLPTLEVRTEATVTKLSFDAHRRATGVRYLRGGSEHTASARVEIVLTAGALATPALLLRSGVGSAAELRMLDIPSVLDARGVGQNLHDHPNVTLFFSGKKEIDCVYPQLYGFHRMASGRGPSDTCFVFYPARSSFKEGLVRMLPAIALPEKIYQQGTAKRLMRSAINGLFAAPPVRSFVGKMWGVVVILGKPKSRGTLRLGAGDRVVIDPAYLADPRDLDLMIDGVEKARALAGASELAAYKGPELIPGPLGRDRAGVVAFIKQNLMTTYHFAGTCRMGDDLFAVVDRRLRVHRVSGLRVADASIVPETPVSAMNAPSMMIGYRAAKMILEDHKS